MNTNQLDELLHEGKLFGEGARYELQVKIGAGGFGQVWQARDTRLERLVAIKFLLLANAHNPENKVTRQRKQRFVTEAKVIAQLKSDYAVKIYDYGEAEGLNYMVMEHIDGVNLYEYQRRYRHLSPFETLLVLEQLLDVLGEAHRQGILHRDIKPTNIMVLRTPHQIRVKLLDFGISKLTEASMLEVRQQLMMLTQDTGMIPGTPAYMAPEQMETGVELTPSADLFSLGLVAVEMVTGKMVRQTTVDCFSNKEIPLAAFGLPPFMLSLLTRMLHQDVSKRYQSAQEVREDIHALIERDDVAKGQRVSAPLWNASTAGPPAGSPPVTPRFAAALAQRDVSPEELVTPALSEARGGLSGPLDIQGMEQTELVAKRATQPTPARNFASIVPGDLMFPGLSARPVAPPSPPLVSRRLVGLVAGFFAMGALGVGGFHLATRPTPDARVLPSQAVLSSLQAHEQASAEQTPSVVPPSKTAAEVVPGVEPAMVQARERLGSSLSSASLAHEVLAQQLQASAGQAESPKVASKNTKSIKKSAALPTTPKQASEPVVAAPTPEDKQVPKSAPADGPKAEEIKPATAETPKKKKRLPIRTDYMHLEP